MGMVDGHESPEHEAECECEECCYFRRHNGLLLIGYLILIGTFNSFIEPFSGFYLSGG